MIQIEDRVVHDEGGDVKAEQRVRFHTLGSGIENNFSMTNV